MHGIRYLLYSPAQHEGLWHALLELAAAHDAWLPDRSVNGMSARPIRDASRHGSPPTPPGSGADLPHPQRRECADRRGLCSVAET